MPRLKPPFPANMGLYGCPTTVNNVEIDRRRARPSCAAAPRGLPGSAAKNNTGTKLFCISGHVEQAVQCRRGDVRSRSAS